mmetsp:Transcript_62213/g.151703  ORF Transcript_62213/g.151703 Transcript_62213/m.151703 type:complete len:85 (-) Transcript_62213:758-1012(-)
MRFNFPDWDHYAQMEDREWPLACIEQSHKLSDSAIFFAFSSAKRSCMICQEDFDHKTGKTTNSFPCLATGDHKSNSLATLSSIR